MGEGLCVLRDAMGMSRFESWKVAESDCVVCCTRLGSLRLKRIDRRESGVLTWVLRARIADGAQCIRERSREDRW